MNQQPPLWDLRNISKAFPGVQALDNVQFTLNTGEVHALVGGNGSGKSTLCKCVAGVYQPDSGEMLYQGEPVTFHHPLEAREYGVGTIYQEFSLVPTLSVAENIFLGRQPRRQGSIDWAEMEKQTTVVLQQLEVDIDPTLAVRHLSVAEQQLVEIAKAISLDSSLLIMDEPTAALGLGETQRLLELIRKLAAQDKAILYISHRLDEVFDVADLVTVFKDGQLVGTHPITELDMNQVVRMMVGVEIEQPYPKVRNIKPVPCLMVEDLATENGVNGVSFTVNVGEVFGLGGMVGAGRTEIGRAIFGLDKPVSGRILLNGREVNFTSPAQAIAAGVGLIPEDRKADGLFFNFEAPQNITISRMKDLLNGKFLNLKRERLFGQQYVDKLNISAGALDKSVLYLSGGNQQKVVIARWLYSQARFVIFDEPTRGIDIGAKIDVYNVINELTAQGISILLISSDYPELLAMSDRVAVVRDGHILHITEGHRLTEYQLTSIASGAEVGNLAQEGIELRAAALPHLHNLRSRWQQTVHLGVLDKEDMMVLYLDKLGIGDTTEMVSQSGALGPVSCTGIGKMLLAFEPAERAQNWIDQHGLPSFTETTITNPNDFMTELANIRHNGFSLDREEHEVGICCIAAPIRNADGRVAAAISVSGPRSRMPADLSNSEMRQDIVKTAATISEVLGYRPEVERA